MNVGKPIVNLPFGDGLFRPTQKNADDWGPWGLGLGRHLFQIQGT